MRLPLLFTLNTQMLISGTSTHNAECCMLFRQCCSDCIAVYYDVPQDTQIGQCVHNESQADEVMLIPARCLCLILSVTSCLDTLKDTMRLVALQSVKSIAPCTSTVA